MYGTLENKNESGDSNGEGTTANQTATNNRRSQDDRKNPKKRIYSHCHVQSAESSDDGAHKVDKSARRRLIATSIICLIFMIGEVAGGVLSNSLAIATDAAHLLTDFASFMISLFAIWLSSRPASKRMSFGWYRAEVIGALISVLMIWLVTGLLVYMAVERIRTQEFEIDSLVMVITASAGLLVNIIMAVVLNIDGHGHSHGFHSHGHGHGHSHGHHHDHSNHSHQDHIDEIERSCERQHIEIFENGIKDTSLEAKSKQLASNNQFPKTLPQVNSNSNNHHDHQCSNEARGRGKSNINVRAAFIHVIGDFLQSLGVLIAALVIHFEPSYAIVDPICTFLFSFIVLITTINIIRDATNVLMEGMPDGINFIEVREGLQDLPSVIRVHNLRIWSLSLDKIAIATHLVIDNSQAPSQVLKEAIYLLKSKYNFFEVTIQIEEYKDDMRDCEHCQDEEVVVKVVGGGNNGTNNQNLA